MGLFDRFKKKEIKYDPTHITVRDLDRNFIFEYDLRTWKVLEKYEYDWGNEYFTYEFKVGDGSEIRYLHLDEDDELELTLSRKIKITSIKKELPAIIRDSERPPDALIFEGISYQLESESPGYFHNCSKKDDDWEELMSWTYYDAEQKHTLCLEQWDDFEFDASAGIVIQEFEISNILPSD